MREYVAIIGLDERESEEIRDSLDVWAISHLVIPKIMVNDGQLWVEAPNGPRLVPVNKVVYHGIFENDLNFMVGLALWGGPCLPNPRAMMDAA